MGHSVRTLRRDCRMCQGTCLSPVQRGSHKLPTLHQLLRCRKLVLYRKHSQSLTGAGPHLSFLLQIQKANRSQSASKATVHTSDYKEINNGQSFYIEDRKGAVQYHSSLFMTFANRPIATSNQEQTKTARGGKQVFVGPWYHLASRPWQIS